MTVAFGVPVDALILFAAGGSLGVCAGIISYVMIAKINRHLPDSDQIDYVFFYPSKAFRISREFRRLYPHSRLNGLRIALLVVGFLLLAAGGYRLNEFRQRHPEMRQGPATLSSGGIGVVLERATGQATDSSVC